MSLHAPEPFSALVLRLPGTTLVEQWESHVGKVGGKVFALLGSRAAHIVFRVPETSFEILMSLEGVSQAPYFAKRRWVAIAPGALTDEDIAAYLANAHRMVAATLTRKARAELGLEAYLATETP